MVTKLKEVDAVVIGMGWTGSILSRELTKAGLNVVGLERGAVRTPREDFAIPSIRDELKYSARHELFQDTALETVTLRHARSETALPMSANTRAARFRMAGSALRIQVTARLYPAVGEVPRKRSSLSDSISAQLVSVFSRSILAMAASTRCFRAL